MLPKRVGLPSSKSVGFDEIRRARRTAVRRRARAARSTVVAAVTGGTVRRRAMRAGALDAARGLARERGGASAARVVQHEHRRSRSFEQLEHALRRSADARLGAELDDRPLQADAAQPRAGRRSRRRSSGGPRAGWNSGSSVRTIASAGRRACVASSRSVGSRRRRRRDSRRLRNRRRVRSAGPAWRATCCSADCGRFWPSSVRQCKEFSGVPTRTVAAP